MKTKACVPQVVVVVKLLHKPANRNGVRKREAWQNNNSSCNLESVTQPELVCYC